MRIFILGVWALAGCGAFGHKAKPHSISHVPVEDYRYYPPCGVPAYSDTLAGGELNVYVLQDSAEVNNCLAPVHRRREDGFPMRYGKDFVLAVEVKGAPGWAVALEMKEGAGLLEIALRPERQDGAAGQYLWHFAADKTEVLRLTGSNGRFAYAKGPAWKTDGDGQEWVGVQGD